MIIPGALLLDVLTLVPLVLEFWAVVAAADRPTELVLSAPVISERMKATKPLAVLTLYHSSATSIKVS